MRPGLVSTREPPPVLWRRLALFSRLLAVSFVLLLARLWMLQVVQGDRMRTLSDENRIRLLRIPAVRGEVRDRHGRVVAETRPSFDVVVVPEDAGDLPTAFAKLSRFVDTSGVELPALLARANGRPKFQEITVLRDLAWHQVVAVETRRLELPGVSLHITPLRYYPYGPILAHLLGYVGEVGREELLRDRHYRMGDLVGKTGLEHVWEKELRGRNGGEQVEVDALGRRLRVLDRVDPTEGNRITLTIDLDLQRSAERALEGREGAVVAVDPRTGEILAMASRPAFDPNLFARGISSREWQRLVRDPLRPLQNRALQGVYPPASVFKVVMAIAALEEGVVTPSSRVFCGGGYRLGNRYFRCWKKGGHGSVDLHEALVQSCDVYFYQVGQRLGIEAIAKWARRLGFGEPTGVGLGSERGGLVPDAAWKKRRFGEPWYPGDTVSVSIGQGFLGVTPVQMALATAALATGTLYRPYYVAEVRAPDGRLRYEGRPERKAELGVSPRTLEAVRRALVDVVESPRGTGKKARVPGVTVAGKTGTAQVVRLRRRSKSGEAVPRWQRDHAWFVAYAPAQDPEIALAVLVEHAGEGGGAAAAPVAREVLETYFGGKWKREGFRYAAFRSATP
ncbi:MAG: penicillin-binding protein 2 [Candidatus Binatia bacterium]|nr:MAG: penicillin-binding protein 2 [Candidatus Binatia bacterium]